MSTQQQGRPRSGASRQKGFAVLTVVVLIAFGVMTVFVALSSRAASSKAGDLDADKRAYLAEIRNGLDLWYRRNASVIDGSDAALDFAQVLSDAGLPARYSVRGQISGRMQASGIAFRVIGIWIPDESNAPTTLDPPTASLVAPPRHWIVFNGRGVQVALFNESLSRLKDAASALEKHARAALEVSPDRNVSVNPFRATDCSRVLPSEIPCVDVHTPVAATVIPALIGFDADRLSDAWGQPIRFSNLAQSNVLQPPFTASVSTTTPWGLPMSVVAVQPY